MRSAKGMTMAEALFILRLFDNGLDNPPSDARLLREGTITLGRDVTTDWVLDDRERRLSRHHLDITAAGGALSIRARGTNGVFDNDNGERFADGEACTVSVPATFSFGSFHLVIDYAAQSSTDDSNAGRTLILSPPLGHTASVPQDYTDSTAPAGTTGDGSLLDCFCQGAGLEPSAFALEEPGDVMRRAGAIYRQMVLGVGDLLAERERVRKQYEIARTTIGGAGNNPFKWGPTQRLALDLLLAEEHGFMSGPGALKASFADIKKHLIATFRGLYASLRTTVDQLDPADIERGTRTRTSVLQSRASAHLAELARRHADLRRQIEHGADGTLNATFVQAYDAAVGELERSEG
jgi:predicted component of type VI protein secretion system